MRLNRVIVGISGGKSSAWCGWWALRHFPKERVILYFNDTKWEHPDTYRFIKELSAYLNHPITEDSDGRSVEEVFYDNHALADNRMPFCSRILKSERLQRYYKNGDVLIFGIGIDEQHRAKRIITQYKRIGDRKKKWATVRFPLIETNTTSTDVDNWLRNTGIEPPLLYKLGFKHNNCSGGCVRAGKKQWKHLYETLPEVYLDRERVEREMREFTGKDIHIFKDETLERFRYRIENHELSAYYYK